LLLLDYFFASVEDGPKAIIKAIKMAEDISLFLISFNTLQSPQTK